jgi:hypothetical protein
VIEELNRLLTKAGLRPVHGVFRYQRP